MARTEAAASGKSLGFAEGLPRLSFGDLPHTLRRGALTALAIGALVVAMAMILLAGGGVADAGIAMDGREVASAEPAGYAWGAGVRAGQTVLVSRNADFGGGWLLATTDGRSVFVAEAAPFDQALRGSFPFALAALALAWLAAWYLRARRAWVLPTAAAGLLVATVPAGFAHGGLSLVVLGASAMVPAVAYGLRLPGGMPVRMVGTLAVVGLAGVWGWAQLTGAPQARRLDDARTIVSILGTFALLGERIALPMISRRTLLTLRPRAIDVLVGASAVVLVVVAAMSFSLPEMALVAVFLGIAIAALRVRSRFEAGIEDALFGDIRAAAATEAAETERGRLARELHDVPMQELAAVIRRLELVPGAEAVNDDLRALAAHLRDVATELRSPVLDDLGLPAALDHLAEETATPTLPVLADVVDDTGFGVDRRPPAEVELAMFRIASEAVVNAVRHSGGSRVRIRAEVAPQRVKLVVADDGAGLATGTAHIAARRKRLGLASMRRRAQAIDAELSIDGSHGGTAVTVLWQA